MTAIDPLATSVALCVYNRPSQTQKVLTALAMVKPKHILIVADGPKQDQPDDREKCDAVIKLIKSIDWPADVEWNVSLSIKAFAPDYRAASLGSSIASRRPLFWRTTAVRIPRSFASARSCWTVTGMIRKSRSSAAATFSSMPIAVRPAISFRAIR